MAAQKPVFVFGAGASKACGSPLTDEILFDAFCVPDIYTVINRQARQDDLRRVADCLRDHFHVTENVKATYPSLPLMLSMIDLAIERNRPFPQGMSRERLTQARSSLEYIIFAVLDYHLRRHIESRAQDGAPNWYEELFNSLLPPGAPAATISLNYDIILDSVMFGRADRVDSVPDYGCDIRTEAYRQRPKLGSLLKLHGSLNWLYCPGCERLDIGMSESARNVATVLNELYDFRPLDKHYLCDKDSCSACLCRDAGCRTPLRSVLIAPTRTKDYRNSHLTRVWYEAERQLRESDHAYLIGYSLPDEDLEVVYLLRRGLQHLQGSSITVIAKDPDEAMVRRYHSLFGQDVDMHPDGLEAWLSHCASPAYAG